MASSSSAVFHLEYFHFVRIDALDVHFGIERQRNRIEAKEIEFHW